MTITATAEWNLGDDSLGRNALKALDEAGITPAAALAMTPKDLAATPGLGIARLERVQAQLDRMRRADAPQRRREQLELQKTQPGYCPACGQPRADHPRNIVTDPRGHLRSVAGSRVEGPFLQPCDDCHAHHVRVIDNATTGAAA